MSLPQLRINKQITVRESQPLEKYLQQVQSVALLTIEEEIECAQLIKQGKEAEADFFTKKKEIFRRIRALKKEDTPASKKKIIALQRKINTLKKKLQEVLAKSKVASEKFMLGNLRFVISVAKQYQNRGLSIGDLINEGNLGLYQATKRFDETRGTKFISYAVSWIRQRILQAIHEKGCLVRKPGSLNSLQQKIYKTYKMLTKRLEREPSQQEIAEELNIPVETVFATQEANIKPLSIDAPFRQGEESTLIELLRNDHASMPEERLIDNSMSEDIERMIDKLDEREQKVIRDYYGFGLKDGFTKILEDIGKEIDLTRERARQLREQALKKLRKFFLQKLNK